MGIHTLSDKRGVAHEHNGQARAAKLTGILFFSNGGVGQERKGSAILTR